MNHAGLPGVSDTGFFGNWHLPPSIYRKYFAQISIHGNLVMWFLIRRHEHSDPSCRTLHVFVSFDLSPLSYCWVHWWCQFWGFQIAHSFVFEHHQPWAHFVSSGLGKSSCKFWLMIIVPFNRGPIPHAWYRTWCDPMDFRLSDSSCDNIILQFCRFVVHCYFSTCVCRIFT